MRAALLGLALGAACGGGGPGAADLPTCTMAKEVHATGQVGTTFYIFVGAVTGYAFVNAIAGRNGTLDVDMDFGARKLHLEWATLIPDGGSAPARGDLDTGTSATDFAFGNCATGGLSGTIFVDGDGQGRFVLRELHQKPYCSGASVDGELDGCFRD